MTEMQERFPAWNISTAEEALNLSLFARHGYDKLKGAGNRVVANCIPSLQDVYHESVGSNHISTHRASQR